MSHPRQVRGLKHVTLESKGPFQSKPKLKGRAALGISYQNKALDQLEPLSRFGTFRREPWFKYRDTYGIHWCQPDGLLELPDRVITIEVKLSLRRLETALVQLNKLYKPTVEMLFQKPAVPLVIFKHWLGEAEIELVDDPEELVYKTLSSIRQPHGWHYLN